MSRRLLEPRGKVVFDLDRSALRGQLGAWRLPVIAATVECDRWGLKLCGMTKPVRALFELVRMHKIFDICGTKDEAIRSFTE